MLRTNILLLLSTGVAAMLVSMTACEPPCDYDCEAGDAPTLLGSEADYAAGPMDYEGFTATPIRECTTGQPTVRVIGSGKLELDFGTGESGGESANDWIYAVTDQLIAQGAPINARGVAVSCLFEDRATMYITTDDWAQVDRLVQRLGNAMADDDLAGAIEIRVEPLVYACADAGACGY